MTMFKKGNINCQEITPDFFAVIVITGIVLTLYSNILDYFWIWEELQVLRHSHEYSPLEYFFIPGVWKKLSIANFTPFLTLSFDLDHVLSGFNPTGFYLHQLIDLCVISLLLYLFLRYWLPWIYCVGGVFLFIFSPPARVAADLLMLRHYLEGGIFALTSALLFVSFLRKKRHLYLFFGVLFYLFAILSKEVYLLIPVVFLFLPEGKTSIRARYSMYFLIAFLVYLLWRLYMLGGHIGGYDRKLISNWSSFLPLLREKGLNALEMITGFHIKSSPWAMMVIVVFFALNIAVLVRKRRISTLWVFLFAVLVMFAPISPPYIRFSPADFQSYRIVFGLAILYSIASVFAFYNLSVNVMRRRDGFGGYCRIAGVMMILFISYVIMAGFNSWRWKNRYEHDIINTLNKEGRFLYENDSDLFLVKTYPFPGNNYYENLNFFKILTKKEGIPIVVSGVNAFLSDTTSKKFDRHPIYRYDRKRNEIIDVTTQYLKRRAAYLKRVKTLDIQGTLKIDKGTISFELGPSTEGRYFIMMGYMPDVYCFVVGVDRQFSINLFTSLRAYLRFGWESPEGWVAFSPEWFIDLSKEYDIKWQ